MAAQKKVEVKIQPNVEDGEVDALENKIAKLKQQQIDLRIKTNQNEISNIDEKIARLKNEINSLSSTELEVKTNATKINELVSEIEKLEAKKIGLEVAVEKDKLESVKGEIDDLDGTDIDVGVNNIAAMEAIDQIGSGFDRLKQGASEVGAAMGDVLNSAGRMEQTEAFLSMNLGADEAKKKLQEIRSVTDQLPGDDVTLQNLLSQAALKDASMTTEAFNQMGSAAADYMAAMQNFGKTSTETQQDLMNYILAGNTAEIERSPILQAHVDKLKEGTTVQERAKLLQEALTAEGWSGIASQDIYNNKLQQFNDMVERGKMNLGGMFLQGSEGAMDFIMQLDQASGGLVGMGIALASFASPVTDTIMGLGQMAMGFNALKDTYTALIPTQIAEGTAGWFSIGWIVVAIALGIALGLALIYLYNNSEQFRNAVNWLGEKLKWLAGIIVSNITNAVNQFSNIIQGIPKAIQACLDWGYNLIMSHPIVQAAIWLGNAIASGFSALGLGQRSPGKIVKSMRQELDWTEEAMRDSSLADSSAKLGSKVASSFNPNLETINKNVSGAVGQTVVININDPVVDNEERMQKIADYIKKSIHWDNTTAGRNV